MTGIYTAYGGNHHDMVTQLLEAADVKSRVPRGGSVVIKPNLVVPKLPEHGATTHVSIVEALIVYLRGQCDTGSITIDEGAWLGAKTPAAFAVCGYNALAEKYGVALLDTKRERTRKISSHGYELDICEVFLRADYFINVPVLKGHCQTDMTCCLKNLKGCIPDSEKSRYHARGLHAPIAALAAALRPHLHIIDNICGDPTFEEGGNPLRTDRILLGFDPVLLDSHCAGLIGLDYREVDHLRLAEQWGVGRFVECNTGHVEFGGGERPRTPPERSNIVRNLAGHINEDGACSACYAALIAALHKSRARPPQPVKIGQGYRGKAVDGVGVGNCTGGCARHLPGCPPKAVDIAAFLKA